MNEAELHSTNLLNVSDLLGAGKVIGSFTSDDVEKVIVEIIKSLKDNPEMIKALEKGINVKKKRLGITIAEIEIKRR
jgi:predicted transcriptional regulator